MNLKELLAKEEKQRADLKAFFDSHRNDNGELEMTAEEVAQVRQMNADLDETAKAREQAQELAKLDSSNEAGLKALSAPVGRKIREDIVGQALPASVLRSVSQVLDGNSNYAAYRAGQFEIGTGHPLDLAAFNDDEWDRMRGSMKAATITLSDISPAPDRQPGIVPSAQARIFVSDLMVPGRTDSNTVTYWEETTFTNAAAETAEGVAKPESTLDYTERTDVVRKIPTWVPITDEALSDNAQLRTEIEGRLIFMVEQREEQQLLIGNGVGTNLQGILNRSGIQTQAKGADPVPDAVYRAMTKVRVTGDAEPTAVVMHPNDWQDVRLLRTADGIYIWGSPADAGPDRIWGLPVRVTTGITENTGLVGAFRPYAVIYRREGLRVVASTEHASFFIENRVALLAETRVALRVSRPAAFCSITGI